MNDLWNKVIQSATAASQKVAETAVKSANVVAEKATIAGQTVADTAVKSANVVAQKATMAGQAVADTAAKSAKTVADAVAVVGGKVSDISKSTYDSMCEFAVEKIKSMLRGVDLQSAIVALQKQQEETGVDVTKVVYFINQLKEFSEDGKE